MKGEKVVEEGEESFRILSWNVQGLATRLNDPDFLPSVQKFHLLCFQETLLAQSKTIVIPGFVSLRFSPGGNGLAVFVQDEWSAHVSLLDFIGSDSTLWVRMQVANFPSVCIACVYNPPSSSRKHDPFFFEKLSDDVTVLLHRFSDPYLVLVGDFNARIGSLAESSNVVSDSAAAQIGLPLSPDSDLFLPRTSCDTVVNRPGRDLLAFCREMQLLILNGRSTDPQGEFTYISTLGHSTIDYALASAELFLEGQTGFRVLDSLSTLHRPIALSLTRVKALKPPKEEKTAQFSLPLKIALSTDQEKAVYVERFERYFPCFAQGMAPILLSGGSADSMVDSLTHCLRMISRPFARRGGQGNGPPWFRKVHQTLRNKARRALRGYRTTRLPNALQRYCSIKKEYRKQLKTSKKLFHRTTSSRIEQALRTNDVKNLWKQIKGAKRKKHATGIISPGKYVAHFRSILQFETENRQEWEVNSDDLPTVEQLDRPITEVEVWNVLLKLKSGKAAGISGISGTQLKLVKAQITPFLTQLFNHVFESGHYPSAWTHALLCPIFKGTGSVSKPESYRGIALLDHVGKCFAKILKERLSGWVQDNKLLSDNQGGFCKGRSTVDNVLILDTLVKKELEKKGGHLYLALVDIRRAFDVCPRSGILFRLKQLGISKKMFSIIQSMLADSKFSVRTSSHAATKGLQSTAGIFQGCPLSPLLFILFLDAVGDKFAKIESESPSLSDRTVRHLLWADDLGLLSTSIAGLQRLLNALSFFCKYWGLNINPMKSKILVFKKGFKLARNEEWFFEGQKLAVVHSGRYLGFELNFNGSWALHKKTAIQKANGALKSLMAFFLRHKNLPAKLFRYVFMAMIDPILLYGAELWSVLPDVASAPRHLRNLPQMLYDASKGLDRPMLRFFRMVLGVPRGTASPAVLLDMGANRCSARGTARAIKYWCKLALLPPEHIMSKCLRQQLLMFDNSLKPWLFYVREILRSYGFGYIWEHGSDDSTHFRNAFLNRVSEVQATFLREEAQSLRSLAFYCEKKDVVGQEPYTNRAFEERRIVAILRMNLKYALPWNPDDGACKLCNEVIPHAAHWSHFLFDCHALPPFDATEPRIVYPDCIPQLIKNANHSVRRRLRFALCTQKK